jgi:DNA replication protein DnaC
MIVQQTLSELKALKLDGMAHAFEEQLTLPSSHALAFEDRFALIVEREAAHRNDRRLARLLAKAKLKYGQACLENLDTRASRGLDARLITTLGHGEWIARGQPLLISGPTGVGKTWLACALAQKACRLGKSALYARLPRLLEELRIARGEGAHKRRLMALAKTEVLILDDWAVQPLEPYGRDDLLEIMDDRAERHPTIITAQLPIEHWHGWIGDATIADAVLDRLLHHAHRLTLKGESLRRTAKSPKSRTDPSPIVTD